MFSLSIAFFSIIALMRTINEAFAEKAGKKCGFKTWPTGKKQNVSRFFTNETFFVEPDDSDVLFF